MEKDFKMIAVGMEKGVLKDEHIRKLTDIFKTALDLKFSLDRYEKEDHHHPCIRGDNGKGKKAI